jgi:hypothetical protein
VAAPIALAAAAAGIVLAGADRGHPAARPAAAASAPVVRTDLASMIQVSGALGFAGSSTIVNQQPGTAYTALPAPGATIRRGQALYEVDGTPVTLFYGPGRRGARCTPGSSPGRTPNSTGTWSRSATAPT